MNQLAPFGPSVGQGGRQADRHARLGQQGHADPGPFAVAEMTQPGSQPAAGQFASGAGKDIGNPEDPDVAEGFNMQMGSGQNEKDHIEGIIDLLQRFQQAVPAG